jgi:hypothetical protein
MAIHIGEADIGNVVIATGVIGVAVCAEGLATIADKTKTGTINGSGQPLPFLLHNFAAFQLEMV